MVPDRGISNNAYSGNRDLSWLIAELLRRVGETARDRPNFCRCFKTGAAVFLHDDGIKLAPSHGTPPSALLAQCLNYSNIKPSSERQLAQIGPENCGANSLSQLGGDHAGHK
jgi:hypothetical protein